MAGTGLSSLISNTGVQQTTLPSWYDTAQQNVVSQAQRPILLLQLPVQPLRKTLLTRYPAQLMRLLQLAEHCKTSLAAQLVHGMLAQLVK